MNATRKYILVADDDRAVARTIQSVLREDGFLCRVVNEGRAVLDETPLQRPDLIILDRMFPDTSGDEVLASLKNDPETADIPVMMVSGLSAESDEVGSLNIGADDYLSKPLSIDRLRAHVAALLRRSVDRAESALGESVDMQRSRQVVVAGSTHHLTPAEHVVLRGLASGGGCVFNQQQLQELLLLTGMAGGEDIAEVMRGLRAHLGTNGAFVHDLGSAGYAFCPPAGTRIRV